MKLQVVGIVACLFLLAVPTALGQQSAAEVAAGLRAQLEDVKAQQADLQQRLLTLDEALKPESIANTLAGVGSTHPEDLREQRRRQLEKEKAGVVAQLERLATSQRRLENAVATAEAAAYQQSAQPNNQVRGPNASDVVDLPKPVRQHRRSRRVKKKRVSRTPSHSN